MNFDLEKFSELLTVYAPKVAGAILTFVIGFWIIGRLTTFLGRTMEKRGWMPLSIRF